MNPNRILESIDPNTTGDSITESIDAIVATKNAINSTGKSKVMAAEVESLNDTRYNLLKKRDYIRDAIAMFPDHE